MNLAIFDIDGTLTNTNGVDDKCFVTALSEVHAITGINTDWSTYPHTTDSGITSHVFKERFGRDPESVELDRLKSCFVDLLNEQHKANSSNFAPIAGAALALSRLQREPDWTVAIATGAWRESALLKLKVANINVNGLPAAFAEDGLSRESILKSAVAKALEKGRVNSFEKTVSIGDGLWDVRTARSLDFAFLGIGRAETAVKLTQAGAKNVIADFVDYDVFIKSLIEAEVPR